VAEEVLDAAHESVVTAVAPGIEDADLDVRLSGQREQLLVAADRLSVIDENTHAHAASSGLAQRLGNELPRLVTMEDVVLQVDGAVGRADQLEPQQQPVDTGREQTES